MRSKAVETKIGFGFAETSWRDRGRAGGGRSVEREHVPGGAGGRRRSGQPVEHGQPALGRLWRCEHTVEHAQAEVGQRAAVAADAGRRGRGQRRGRGRRGLNVTVFLVHEVAPLTVRAVSGRVERAARLRLVLGVPEHGPKVLFAVRELTLVAVRALDLLDVLTAHFRLVPRAHRRLGRQLLILLLLLLSLLLLLRLLLFAGPVTVATALSRTASWLRRHGSLIATTAAAAASRRHHFLPPVLHFCGDRAWSILCLQKNNTNI